VNEPDEDEEFSTFGELKSGEARWGKWEQGRPIGFA